MKSRHFISRVFAAVMAAFSVMPSIVAHAQPVGETQIKAALLYNFVVFTDWPSTNLNAASPLTICIAHDSELRDELQLLETKTVRNRQLKINPLSDTTDFSKCNVLYMESRKLTDWPQIRKKLEGKSVLTIGEGTAMEGIMISVSLVNGRMVFDINSSAARAASLLISSKLLRLAREVY